MKVKNNNNQLYNSWHNQLDVDKDIDTPWHRFVISKISEINMKDKCILEIGCGRGGFACWLAEKYNKKYKEFFAADYSSVAIEKASFYAASNKIKGIKWEVKDIMKTDYPDKYFDIVISCETIEHVTKPFKAIKELYRVTKCGGILILTTPNYGNFMGLYRIWLRLTGRKWKEVGQPINNFVFFLKTKLWLKLAGFRIIYAGSQNITFPSPFLKREIKLDWKKPRIIVKSLGINSFFIAVKK